MKRDRGQDGPKPHDASARRIWLRLSLTELIVTVAAFAAFNAGLMAVFRQMDRDLATANGDPFAVVTRVFRVPVAGMFPVEVEDEASLFWLLNVNILVLFVMPMLLIEKTVRQVLSWRWQRRMAATPS